MTKPRFYRGVFLHPWMPMNIDGLWDSLQKGWWCEGGGHKYCGTTIESAYKGWSKNEADRLAKMKREAFLRGFRDGLGLGPIWRRILK